MQTAALTSRFVLACVFVLAGLAKLPRRGKFAVTVARYDLLPPRLIRPFALALPVAELAVGAALAVGVATRAAAAAACVALVVFTAATALSLARGKRLECGCFGVGAPRPITWTTVGRNLALVACAVLATAAAPRVLSVDSLVFGADGAVSRADAAALAIAATLTVLGAFVAVEALRSLRFLRTTGAS